MGDADILFRFPAGVTYFLFSKIAGRGWSTPIFPVGSKQSLFTPGINFTPNAPTLTAGVKNGLDFTSPTPCLHGVSRVNFPLYRQGRSTCTLTETQSPLPPSTRISRKAILPTAIFLRTIPPLGCEKLLYSGTENLLMVRVVS